jgi:hypothetical protein
MLANFHFGIVPEKLCTRKWMPNQLSRQTFALDHSTKPEAIETVPQGLPVIEMGDSSLCRSICAGDSRRGQRCTLRGGQEVDDVLLQTAKPLRSFGSFSVGK